VSSLKRLSANQLNKMLDETRAELKRRENINKARRDIQAVLEKYSITIHDIDLNFSSRKPATKKVTSKKGTAKNSSIKRMAAKKYATKALRKNDQRATVAAKYHNPATGDKWSGRGRAPAWVIQLCAAETIDIEKFKADPRFRI